MALDALPPLTADASDDGSCCICMEVTHFENSLMVRCADCALRVHVKCYGRSLLTDAAQWRCEACEYMRQSPRPAVAPHCAVCPISGGALRLTAQPGVWSHVLCINWVPELFHSLANVMDEQVDIALLDASRENLRCILCGLRGGCIQCVSGRCARAFHVLCAFRAPSCLLFTGYNGDNLQVYHCKTHLNDVSPKHSAVVDNSWRTQPDVVKYIREHPLLHGPCRFCGSSKMGAANRELHETHCLISWMAKEGAERRKKELAQAGVTPPQIAYAHPKSPPSKNGKSRNKKKAGSHETNGSARTGKYKRHPETTRTCPDCGESIRETLLTAHRKNSCPKARRADGKRNNRLMSPRPFGNGGLMEGTDAGDLSDVLFASWPGQNSGAPLDSAYFWKLMENHFFGSKVFAKKRMEQLTKALCGVKLEDVAKTSRRRALQTSDIHCRDTLRLDRSMDDSDPKKPLTLQKVVHRCDFLMRASHCRCLNDQLSKPVIEITPAADYVEPVATSASEQPRATVPEDAEANIRVLFKNGEDAALDCKYSMRVSKTGNLSTADDGTFASSFQHDAFSTLIGFDMQNRKVPLAEDNQLLISLDACDQVDTPKTESQEAADELTPAINLLLEHLKDRMEQNRFRIRGLYKRLQGKEAKETQFQLLAQTTEMYYREFSAWKRLCASLVIGYNIQSQDEAGKAKAESDEQEVGSTEDEDDSIDDGTCVVCFDGQSPETNPIIFCDRCELAVHQRCYGVAKVPSSEFICDRCRAAREGLDPSTDVFCQLCSLSDGAFKRTIDGKWVHVVCALWCPKVWIGNLFELSDISLMGTSNQVRFVDPVSEVNTRIAQASTNQHPAQKAGDHVTQPDLPALELGSLCVHCRVACGRTIQCCHPGCDTSFHPLCGWYEGLPMTISLNDKGYMYAGGGAGLKFAMFCERHLPDNYPASEQLTQRRRRARFRIDSFFVIRNKDNFSTGAKKQGDAGSSLLSGSIVQAVISAEKKIAATDNDSEAADWTDMTVCSACFEYCAPIVGELKDVNMLHRRQFMIRCQYCNVYIHPECCISDIGSSASIFRSNWICERCTQTGGKGSPDCVVCAKSADYLMPCADPPSLPASKQPPPMQALPGSKALSTAIRAAPDGGNQLWLEPHKMQRQLSAGSNTSSSNGVPISASSSKWIHVYCSKWQKAKTVKRHHMLCAYAPEIKQEGSSSRCDLCFKKEGMLANCAQCHRRFHPICAAQKKLFCARSNRTDWKFYCEAHPPADAAFDANRQTWITSEIMSQLRDLRRSLERGRMLLEMSRQRDRQHKRLLNFCKLPLMEESIEIVLKKRPSALMKEVYHTFTGETLRDIPKPKPVPSPRAEPKTRTRNSPRASRSGTKRSAARSATPERTSKRRRTGSGDSEATPTRNTRRSSRRKSLRFTEEASDDEDMEGDEADEKEIEAQKAIWSSLPVPEKPEHFDPVVEDQFPELLD